MISHVLRYRSADESSQVVYSAKKDAGAPFSDSSDSVDMYEDPTPKFSLDVIMKGFIVNIPSESSVPHADDFAKMYAKPKNVPVATGAPESEDGMSVFTVNSESSCDSDFSDDSQTNLIDSDDDEDEYSHMPFTPRADDSHKHTPRFDTPSSRTKNHTHFFREDSGVFEAKKLNKQNLSKIQSNLGGREKSPNTELHILPPCLFPRRRKKAHSSGNLPVLQFKVSLINFSSGDFLEGYVANVRQQSIASVKKRNPR